MKRLRLGLMIVAAAVLEGQRLPVSPETGANLPARKIGVNDLLSVIVYGAPELSRTVRVGADGLIRLPMLPGKLEALGAMPAEMETRVAEAFAEARIVVEPVVTVNIAEYGSKPLSVTGAVRRPLTFEVHHAITLLDALARAEGLNADAGKEILVTRPGAEPGDTPRMERVSVQDLMQSANPSANLMLEGGEEVRVPEAGRVFVVGNVKKPGAFRVDTSSATTVMEALALSEGLAPFSAKEAFIYRSTDGVKKEIVVTLKKILDRKAEDVQLEPNDIFYVPDNRRGRATAGALERALSFAVGTASGALILGVNR